MARKRFQPVTILLYTLGIAFGIACVFPLLLSVAGSLSLEEDTLRYGYTLFPRRISLFAYQVIFADYARVLRAYGITITVTALGSVFSLLINSMIAYALSKRSLRLRKALSLYCLITILFSGGMVPWYIVCVNILHLKNNLLALIVPYLANGWYIFLLRNFMQELPDEMHESATIDGAREMTIYWRIILPLSKPALATVALFIAVGYWNDWWLGLMLIDKTQLQPLQMLLRIIVSNVDFLRSSPNVARMSSEFFMMPSEGIRMAMGIITIGPIILLYPFVQKYFIKGILIGAVKG